MKMIITFDFLYSIERTQFPSRLTQNLQKENVSERLDLPAFSYCYIIQITKQLKSRWFFNMIRLSLSLFSLHAPKTCVILSFYFTLLVTTQATNFCITQQTFFSFGFGGVKRNLYKMKKKIYLCVIDFFFEAMYLLFATALDD